jgi:hypothetical protein
MSAKRGDRVAPPAGPGEWEVLFGTNDAAKGWLELCAQAPGNTRDAWVAMRTDPLPAVRTPRHHPLKGALAMGTYRGRLLHQWQIEVTSGGRIWYLADADARKVFVMYAGTGHPKATE